MTGLEQVYRDSRASLLRSLTSRCKWEAEEVLHEAVVKLLALDRPDHKALPALIYRTAVNLFLDHRKREATHARLNPIAVTGPENFAPSPDGALSESQLAERFERALGQLVIEHEDWARAFLLRTQHELEWTDIGRQMGVGARMVQIYVARAVEYCHEYIEP